MDEETPVEFFEEAPTVADDQVNLVVQTKAQFDGELDTYMPTAPSGALGHDEGTFDRA